MTSPSKPAPAPDLTAALARPRPMRADARRNYERLLRAGAEVFVEQGAGASLDEIARRAGVGPGTLYRHFPTRLALLEAVFVERVEILAEAARELAASEAPADALLRWLAVFAEHVGTFRGLGLALMEKAGAEAPPPAPAADREDGDEEEPRGEGARPVPPEAAAKGPFMAACHGVLTASVQGLLARAQEAGEIRTDITASDLLRLGNAVALATETTPDRGAAAARYLSLLVDGMRVRSGPLSGK